LWTYDFRRTEMCVIPYATQEGEISFCAYNTGIGWRNIIEKMHMTATLTKWYEEHGRHAIYAGGKSVPLADTSHSLKLNPEHVARGPQVSEGPQTARDEKARKRDAEMMKLYRQHVLKEKTVDLVQITSPKLASKPKVAEPEGELVAGD
ncbi:MAG TPA: radical SAM protein, partial [Terriglobia bacterium]|nr:radical SAM protein [Terriglobia bacterium]